MVEVHHHDTAHVQRAFDRARRVLSLAERKGAPAPSVTLYSDGSACFHFPHALARAVGAKAGEIINLIGSERQVGTEDGVDIHVCCMLGREHDEPEKEPSRD